jgi:hypothetical protein
MGLKEDADYSQARSANEGAAHGVGLLENGLPGGSRCFAGPDSLRDRLGRMSSISTNDRPCNQHHLRFSSLKPSESRPSKDALACSRRHMTARCIDAQLDVPIMVHAPTPSGRLAQRSQRWSCSSREQTSSTGTLRMMSACSWPECSLCAHSAMMCKAQQRLKRQARPAHHGSPCGRKFCSFSRCGRQRKLPWWLIIPRAESGCILDWPSRSSADGGETTAESAVGVLEQHPIRRHCL